ncbi:ArnT family glycosyltransferase [Candidatus Eisenbacteria bacterium]|uniref:ArnT family glycosyltransferase n=1 Tax=Eiseniibacteriota bacterium TaxID=2212470 RepID=A0ABV6YKN5_UNCEI
MSAAQHSGNHSLVGRAWPIRLVAPVYALVFCAIGLWIHLAFYPLGNVGVESDFYAELAPAAQKLADGDFSVQNFPYKGPAFAVLLALVRPLVGDWYRAGVLISLVSAGLSILLIYAILRSAFRPALAIGSTVLVSLLNPFLLGAYKAASDLLFLCAVLCSLWLLMRWPSRRGRLLLAGLAAAVAFLTRYNGVVFLVAGTLALLVINPQHLSRRQRLRGWIWYLVGFGILSIPWLAWSFADTGRLLWSQNLHNVNLAFYGPSVKAAADVREFPSLVALIAHDPLYFTGRYLANLAEHVRLDARLLLEPILAVLAAFGLMRLLLVRPTRRQGILYAATLLYILAMGVVFYLPRFFLILGLGYVPLALSVLMGSDADSATAELTSLGRSLRHSCDRLCAWWLLWRRRHRTIWHMLLVLVIAALAVGKLHTFKTVEAVQRGTRPLFLIPAAQFLRTMDTGGQRALLMARRPHLAFLADCDHLRYPDEVPSLVDLLRYADSRGADYLTYGLHEFSDYPQLGYISAAESIPGLRVIYRSDQLVVFHLPEELDLVMIDAVEQELKMHYARSEAAAAGDLHEWLVHSRALAEHYLQRGHEDQAGQLLAKALRGTSRPADSPATRALRGSLCHTLATIRLNQDDWDTAESLLVISCEELKAGTNSAELARAQATLGNVYQHQGRAAEALAAYELAIRNFRAGGDEQMVAEATAKAAQLRKRLEDEH